MSASDPATSRSHRYGIVDLGSNAIRLLVIEVGGNRDFVVLESHRQPVRMGRDVFLTGRVQDDTVAAAIDALRRFRTSCDRHGVHHIRAIATSATREARNRDEIVERIRDEASIDVEVISGTEEAYLLGRAVQTKVDLEEGRSLLVDLGGGSVEVVLVDKGQVVGADSYRLGALRLLQALTGTEGGSFLDLLHRHIGGLEKRIANRFRGEKIDRYIATGGNIDTLADLRRDPEKRRNGQVESLTLDDLREEVKELALLSYAERMEKKGLRPDRADTILPAGVVYLRLGEIAGVDQVLVPRVGIKDGLVQEVVRGHLRAFRAEDHVETALAACRSLGNKHRYDSDHAETTRDLATQLFEQTKVLHGLDAGARVILEAAALLHDIGVTVNNARHHKHSWYIIRETDLVGWNEHERNLVALVARYHRRAIPNRQHFGYRDLRRKDRELVSKLAAILRVADAMDRTHSGSIRSITVTVRGDVVEIAPTLAAGQESGLTLEQRAVEEKGDLFELEFGLPIRLLQP